MFIDTMNYPHKRYERLLEPLFDDSTVMNQHNAHATSVHVAILVKRGQVLSMATNRIGSRSRGAAYSFVSIHAERNCVKQLGDLSKLNGADLIVVRIPPAGNSYSQERRFMKSKPCAGCQLFLEKCMREYGLKNVYYSDGNGCDSPSKCTLLASDPTLRCASSCSNARSDSHSRSSSPASCNSKNSSSSTSMQKRCSSSSTGMQKRCSTPSSSSSPPTSRHSSRSSSPSTPSHSPTPTHRKNGKETVRWPKNSSSLPAPATGVQGRCSSSSSSATGVQQRYSSTRSSSSSTSL